MSAIIWNKVNAYILWAECKLVQLLWEKNLALPSNVCVYDKYPSSSNSDKYKVEI